MRYDQYGHFRTLEKDINEIWELHGWKVTEEKVSKNTWTITAKWQGKNRSKYHISIGNKSNK